MYHMQQKKLLTIWSTCLLKGQVFHELKSLNWLILLTIYLVWLSYSYCFIFDYNYSSFALRLQTSQHLILDLLYLKQWKAAKVRAKRINQNLEIFIGNTGTFNRLMLSLFSKDISLLFYRYLFRIQCLGFC